MGESDWKTSDWYKSLPKRYRLIAELTWSESPNRNFLLVPASGNIRGMHAWLASFQQLFQKDKYHGNRPGGYIRPSDMVSSYCIAIPLAIILTERKLSYSEFLHIHLSAKGGWRILQHDGKVQAYEDLSHNMNAMVSKPAGIKAYFEKAMNVKYLAVGIDKDGKSKYGFVDSVDANDFLVRVKERLAKLEEEEPVEINLGERIKFARASPTLQAGIGRISGKSTWVEVVTGEGKWRRLGGDRLLIVHEGKLTVVFKKASPPVSMEKGDMLAIKQRVDHKLISTGEEPAVILVV